MNRGLLIFVSALLLALVLSGCGTSPDVIAAEQVVTQSEGAAVKALNGQGSIADVEQYFATTLEGGNVDTQMANHIAYSAPLTKQTPGFVQLSNFQITGVNVDLQKREARVIYQVDVTITGANGKNTATVTQDLLLVKTPTRGWRIAAGDGPQTGDGDNTFLGNLLQQ